MMNIFHQVNRSAQTLLYSRKELTTQKNVGKRIDCSIYHDYNKFQAA
jgi:hypothetical protein